jgi:hypothetical protein
MTTLTTRERLKGEGFEFEGLHPLCAAFRRKAEKEATGHTCVIVPETFDGPERATVYFLGYRRTVPKPTRRERGCFGKGENEHAITNR